MENKSQYTTVRKQIVRYEYLNYHGTLFGGQMTAWIDESAGIFAMEVMKSKRIVTLKISEIMFKEPVRLGDILEYSCKVNKEGVSSLTIGVRVRAILEKEIRDVCDAEIVFVNLNEDGNPTPWKIQMD